MRVVQAYITSMVGSVDVVARDQSLDDPLDDGEQVLSKELQGVPVYGWLYGVRVWFQCYSMLRLFDVLNYV